MHRTTFLCSISALTGAYPITPLLPFTRITMASCGLVLMMDLINMMVIRSRYSATLLGILPLSGIIILFPLTEMPIIMYGLDVKRGFISTIHHRVNFRARGLKRWTGSGSFHPANLFRRSAASETGRVCWRLFPDTD